MIKQMILIAALLPASVHAHEWRQDYWLERLSRNHMKIGECYDVFINNEDRKAFDKDCSLHTMGYVENKLLAELKLARLHHPLMSDVEFVAHHFGDSFTIPDQVLILENIRIIETIAMRAIITMHIAEGLTRNDK